MTLNVKRWRKRRKDNFVSGGLLLFLLVLAFASCKVEARFDAISVESGSRLISLGSGFGFTPGGTLNISIDVKVIFANPTQLTGFLKKRRNSHENTIDKIAFVQLQVSLIVQQLSMAHSDDRGQRKKLHALRRHALRIQR